MSNNIEDLFANVNIPDDVKQMINNLQNNNQNNNSASGPQQGSPDLNNLLSQVSPEMLNNLSSILILIHKILLMHLLIPTIILI